MTFSVAGICSDIGMMGCHCLWRGIEALGPFTTAEGHKGNNSIAMGNLLANMDEPKVMVNAFQKSLFRRAFIDISSAHHSVPCLFFSLSLFHQYFMLLKLFYKKVKIGVVLWMLVRIIRPRCHGVRPRTALQQVDFSKIFKDF